MKIGVFSDVHGNLEAFQVCLARLKKEGAEAYINCGDIIGYGPDSEACVEMLMMLPSVQSVMGNHDIVFIEPQIEDFFHFDAKIALDISKKNISDTSKRFLASLPVIIKTEDYTVAHGTPSDPVKEYFVSIRQFYKNYSRWKGQVCFVGHTHLPFYMEGIEKECKLVLNKEESFVLSLNSQKRYVINPGSVGKPRDNRPEASFGLWDTEKGTFAFIREPYNFIVTQRKMKERGYPSFLIDGLAMGL